MIKFIQSLYNDELGNLKIYQGINNISVKQIIYYANNDEAIKRYTSDPVRFRDNKSFNQWLEKDRVIYLLIRDQDELMGIIWLGSEKIPTDRVFISEFNASHYGITIAIRIYGVGRGKHLASKFMDSVLNDFYKSGRYLELQNKGIWLETTFDNIPAVKLYSRSGFKQVSGPDHNNKILMILEG